LSNQSLKVKHSLIAKGESYLLIEKAIEKGGYMMSEKKLKKLCQEFARILGGSGSLDENGVCLVQKFRNIDFTILDRKTNSPLVNPQFFSFENLDKKGNALNLGETVLLQEEVNPLLTELRKRDLIVTAIHNHWLFEEPRAMYMHFESVEPPLQFARKVREAFKVLKR
jgi:Domain of Unknown Function (DUF1259)